MAIPGDSGHEGQIVATIIEKLKAAGAPAAAISTDDAHRRTIIKGQVGNLVLKLPGTLRGPRRMLLAHVDTVPLCVGSRPSLRGGWVESANKLTGLGADNRAGAAVVLNTALEVLRRGLPHPPLTFLWPVQEEVGLQGVQHARLARFGKPKLAFNWDGGPAEKLTLGATGAYRLSIEITGLASHAGGAPEQGISAIGIAGLAIADLVRAGWHGDIQREGRRGTSNFGTITGGRANNVVADRCEVRAEARSHDPQFRREIVAAIEQAFRQAAREVTNVAGAAGGVEISQRLDYESFVLPSDAPCVELAARAIEAIGQNPVKAISNGGLDANWLTARGIPTVTLGCGQKNAHTVAERLDVAAFHSACRIALRLATGS
ncbi:MAG: M20/M25/M40 family metallo-hydrolase [Pirellulales bacterium]|nr:M20/M25/M40 family metallo-hydrolase [Pirellulales bacterium]